MFCIIKELHPAVMITPFECHTDPVLSPSNGVEYALRWRTQDIGFWLQYIKKKQTKTTKYHFKYLNFIERWFINSILT